MKTLLIISNCITIISLPILLYLGYYFFPVLLLMTKTPGLTRWIIVFCIFSLIIFLLLFLSIPLSWIFHNSEKNTLAIFFACAPFLSFIMLMAGLYLYIAADNQRTLDKVEDFERIPTKSLEK